MIAIEMASSACKVTEETIDNKETGSTFHNGKGSVALPVDIGSEMKGEKAV